MEIPKPILRKADSTSHFFYSFLGTVDRKWRCNKWMFAKVGVAVDVHRRLTKYKTHCPIPFSAGIRAKLPTPAAARKIEKAMLADPDLVGYKSQGEWFVIFAGPEQHVLFLASLLARFYLERYKDKSLWSVPLEWMILPDKERIEKVPGANLDFLCGPEDGKGYSLESAANELEKERALRVRAQDQAEAIGRLLYPEFDF